MIVPLTVAQQHSKTIINKTRSKYNRLMNKKIPKSEKAEKLRELMKPVPKWKNQITHTLTKSCFTCDD